MRLRSDSGTRVGIVIPVAVSTPGWQLTECIDAIHDAMDLKVRGDENIVAEKPYIYLDIILSTEDGGYLPVDSLGGRDLQQGVSSTILRGYGSSFAQNTNRGILFALEHRCDMIVLLNADTHISPGNLESWLGYLASYDDLAICGCVSNEIGGPARMPFGPKSPMVHAEGVARGLKDWNQGSEGNESLKDTVRRTARGCRNQYSGHLQDASDIKMVAAAIPAWVFDHIGFLDERFRPGNREDVDWCWRVRQAGFRTAFAHDVFIHHYGSTSFADGGVWEKAMRDNQSRFNAKWSHTSRYQIEQHASDLVIRPDAFLSIMEREEPYSLDPLLWRADALSSLRPRAAIRDLHGYLGVHERDPHALWILCECLGRIGRHADALDIAADMRCWFPLHKEQIADLTAALRKEVP